MNRRSFFASVAAAVVLRRLPPPPPVFDVARYREKTILFPFRYSGVMTGRFYGKSLPNLENVPRSRG